MRQLRIAVIGGGFGGIAAAIGLTRAGFTDVTVYERADDIGGVWRDNTYPGSACDVPTYLYSFSFALKKDWQRKFAGQQEILDYLRDVADEFDVVRHVRLGTEVRSAGFDEATGRWRLELSSGTEEADVVVAACGQLSQPAYPRIPGLASFGGATFHSARWDRDYDLAGRRVGVIGTGASAIQLVPEVAAQAGSVTVFQRDAAFVIAKPDREYPQPLSTPSLMARRWATYWVKEATSVRFNHLPGLFERLERRFDHYLAAQVSDPETRAGLRPSSRMGCKRILVSNDYYAAFNRPTVSLVREPISQVTPTGVCTADGREHPLDALLLATGFQATQFLTPLAVTGRGGRELSQEWRDGAEAYLGITVTGFPNFFMVYGPNTNLGHNSIIFMIECQVAYIVRCARLLAAGDAAWMDVRPRTQQTYNAAVQRRSRRTVFATGCASWYVSPSGRYTANWPGSTAGYWLRTRRLRRRDYQVVARRETAAVASV